MHRYVEHACMHARTRKKKTQDKPKENPAMLLHSAGDKTTQSALPFRVTMSTLCSLGAFLRGFLIGLEGEG